MTFSYDLGTDVGKVRLNLRDTTEGFGPFPDGGNFSDEEVTALFTQESNSTMRTVAACCEVLATAWAAFSGGLRGGQRSETYNQAKAYADRAAVLRAQFGGVPGGVAFAIDTRRIDGYSEAADAGGNDFERPPGFWPT